MKKIITYTKLLIFVFAAFYAKNSSAQCAAGFNYTYNANGNVSFYSTSTAATLSTLSYTWDYGDSSPFTVGTQTYVSHTYPNGTYIASLTIKTYSPSFCADTLTNVITVTNSACGTNLIPSFTYTNNGLGTYTFNSTSLNTSSTTVLQWTYGDSNTGTGTPASHTYSSSGTYTVKLALYDGPCSDSITSVINVSTNPCTVTPAFTYSYNAPGQYYQFTNTSTGTIAATSYTWNFGDGNFSNLANYPTHAYSTAGNYTVTLSATNSTASPCIMTVTHTLSAVTPTTVPCNLVAGFTHTVGAGGFVNFNNASTGTSSLSLYHWDFADGYVSNSQNPTHTFSSAGAYSVSLIVNNQTTPACIDTIIQFVNVTGVSCTANSSFSIAPTATAQVWNVTPNFPWTIISANWSWGDNSSSSTLYTSHTYSAAGIYSICLTVTVSCGATSSNCDTSFIYRSNQTAQVVKINVTAPAKTVTGIDVTTNASLDFMLYPNPNNGQFELKINSLQNETTLIKIYNLIGQTVYETKIVNDGEAKNINLDNASNGIYFIKMSSGSKEFTKKIIVNK